MPLVCSVAGIVLGYLARAEIDVDPDLGGRGLATAGLITGFVGLGAWIVVAVALVA